MSTRKRLNRKKHSKGKKTRGPMERLPLRSPRHLLPEQIEATLTYNTSHDFVDASPYAAYPFLTNGAWDVDPALGSTATVGLSEFAAFYSGMRVLGYSGSCDFLSTGQYATEAYCFHTPQDLGITAGGALFLLQPYVGNPNMQRFLLGHSYSPQGKHTFRFRKTISQVFGGPEPYTDDKFASSTSTLPSAKTYLILGARCFGTNLLNSPVRIVLTLNMRVRFFQRKALSA